MEDEMTVLEALRRSGEEVQERAEAHRRLLARHVGRAPARRSATEALRRDVPARAADGGDLDSPVCLPFDCPHRRLLRETLADAIAVLEETRRAFKSKRLQALRKSLTEILARNA